MEAGLVGRAEGWACRWVLVSSIAQLFLYTTIVVADVAYALVRAASRLVSTPGRRCCDDSCELKLQRRDESRRGTHECVRHITAGCARSRLGPSFSPDRASPS